MKRYHCIVILLILIIAPVVNAQKQLTLVQAVLKQGTEFRPKTFNGFGWHPKTSAYSYVSGDSLIAVNPSNLQKTVIITLPELNKTLEGSGIKPVGRLLPIWNSNGTLRITSGNTYVFFDPLSKQVLSKFNVEEGSENHEFSPDGRWLSYTMGQNLFLLSSAGDIKAVTSDTVDGYVNGQSVHRNEFGITKGIFWSPSGHYLAYYHMDETMVTKYPLIDISKRVAELVNIRYPMAGMKSHEVTIRVYDTKTGESVELKTGEPREQYLTNIAWSPDEKSIYVAVLNRQQNHLKLNRYRVSDGQFELTLFEEANKKYVEPLNPPMFLNDGSFLWLSRRDGWNHIYRYFADGKLVKQLTKGEWEVIDIGGFDSKRGTLYFTATKESPLERHLYSLEVKNGKLTRLTRGEGTHRCYISPDYKYFIDFYSSISLPNRVTLFTTSGKEKKLLLDAPNPYSDYSVPLPSLLSLRANDGTILYGRIIKPIDFDSTKRYPVVIYVYGGPHSQLVTNSWMGGARLWECYMANKGYILFTLDNRGTSNRGAEFEQTIHRRLGTMELSDQLEGLKYLKSLPFVDSTRVGVHGWSYGGFMTITMMLRAPEYFKAGVAGGSVTDWRFYEVMYGERYMDTPDENPDGYQTADLKNYATNLKGKLLIIHDDMDKTVVPQHSLTLLHEFVKSGVQVDFFMYPQHDHNVIGKDRVHLIDKVIRYFDENL